MAAELEMSALTIVPSKILAEVTAPFAMVKTPALSLVTSPDAVVYVGTPDALATINWADVPDANFERAIAAVFEISALVMVPSRISVEVTPPVLIETAPELVEKFDEENYAIPLAAGVASSIVIIDPEPELLASVSAPVNESS